MDDEAEKQKRYRLDREISELAIRNGWRSFIEGVARWCKVNETALPEALKGLKDG